MSKKLKLLLYCTKSKPYLVRNESDKYWYSMKQFQLDTFKNVKTYNGKIVGECDFEVEKIYYSPMFCNYTTWSLGKDDLLDKSCLTYDELKNYLGTKDVIGNDGYNGYAIHIKNLHIFDEPKELSEYGMDFPISPIVKAPQNMMYANGVGERYILISIQPQWLCKILNGEKTIEVRKKVLKEMIG